jgi:hypothetical protein
MFHYDKKKILASVNWEENGGIYCTNEKKCSDETIRMVGLLHRREFYPDYSLAKRSILQFFLVK